MAAQTPALPLSQIQVSDLIGVSTRRLRQLSSVGEGPPLGYLPFDVGKWMHARWAREVGLTKDGEAYDYDIERARLTHHQANIASLDEQVKARTLIPSDVVINRWTAIHANVRAKLLSIPPQLAGSCADMPRDMVESTAKALIYQALAELSDDIEY